MKVVRRKRRRSEDPLNGKEMYDWTANDVKEGRQAVFDSNLSS